MEQRSLRLGDIVDDYCPRERRITNHAIVAIVEDAIRQTRCTTCDYEHGFKQGREPQRRKKPPESLYEQVLADVAGAQLVAPPAVGDGLAAPVVEAATDPIEPHDGDTPEHGAAEDTWPAHRSLIRATLPRTEGEPPPPRPIPEFTMHQKPQPARGRGPFRRLAFGPQGDPFGPSPDGRPGRGGQQAPGRGGRNGDGNTAGNGQGNGNAGEPGQRRGRRRRGGQRSR
jgi:hypothetical protein